MKVINDKRGAPKEYGWFMKKCISPVNTAVYKQAECGKWSCATIWCILKQWWSIPVGDSGRKPCSVEEQGWAFENGSKKASQAEKDTLPKQKYTTCGNKLEGWNDLGLNHFNELMDEVEEDQERQEWQQEVWKWIPVGSSGTVPTREKEEQHASARGSKSQNKKWPWQWQWWQSQHWHCLVGPSHR